MTEKGEIPRLSLGDIIDRLSILTRKIHFGEQDAYKEYDYLVKGLTAMGYNGEMIAYSIKLTQANQDIWNLENEIRKLGDPVEKLGMEEIGRRAMLIRDHNKKRIGYKNDLNRLSGCDFVEFKTHHRSQ